MRSALLLPAIALAMLAPAACSSPPSIGDGASDTGATSPLDTAIDSGTPADAGVEGSSDAPDARPADDAITLDTASDAPTGDGAADVADAPTDIGTVGDAADPANQRAWCIAGAPRLVWSDAVHACGDLTLGVACFFAPTSVGLRCVPTKIEEVGGYLNSSCSHAFDVLTKDTATYAAGFAPKYVSIVLADGTYEAHQDSTIARPGPAGSGAWWSNDTGTCVEQTTDYPYADSAGQTLIATMLVPSDSLVGAP